jgi:hypothetical protein
MKIESFKEFEKLRVCIPKTLLIKWDKEIDTLPPFSYYS